MTYLKRQYVLYVCPQCSEPYPFAGFCDECDKKLEFVKVVPTPIIEETHKKFYGVSATEFVDLLLEHHAT